MECTLGACRKSASIFAFCRFCSLAILLFPRQRFLIIFCQAKKVDWPVGPLGGIPEEPAVGRLENVKF